MVIVTTIRRDVLTLPAAPLGPDNPLPPLRLVHEVHRVDARDRDDLPRDMARQAGYGQARQPAAGPRPGRLRQNARTP